MKIELTPKNPAGLELVVKALEPEDDPDPDDWWKRSETL
jgi:hypothetical protein